jgi:hypothetical protein
MYRRFVFAAATLLLLGAVAVAALVLSGRTAQPQPPVPPPAASPGQDFLPVWMDHIAHPPPPPVCEPADLTELMLGC